MFHVFTQGPEGSVDAATMEGAATVGVEKLQYAISEFCEA
jgi:hypothetical protein